MKRTNPIGLAMSVGIATWLLERATFGFHDEAMSGDLLEELEHGRSVGWYWQQVFSAIGIGFVNRFRSYAMPLGFSVGWSLFYPAWWLYVERSPFVVATFVRWLALDWPPSISMKLVVEILPIVTFLWFGFFVYLTSHPEMLRELSTFRLLRSLSISLNVLFVCFLFHCMPHAADVRNVTRETLYASVPLIRLSAAFALSLMSAILSARPRVGRRQQPVAVQGEG